MGKISDALEKFGQTEMQDAAEATPVPPLETVNVKTNKKISPKKNQPVFNDKVGRKQHGDNRISSKSLPQTDEPHLKSESPDIERPLPQPQSINDKLVAIHDPHSFEAEQFRLLRTNIMFPAEGSKAPRSLLIYSTHPGDGKSFVAANLATIETSSVFPIIFWWWWCS